ncbi:hypothetical protein D3C76_819160 [compost metagenome]
MQLVEQRLELVVADLVAVCADGLGNGHGRSLLGRRLQGVEQLLELGIGDVCVAGRFGLHHHLLDHRRQLGAFRLGQPRQRRQQRRRGRRRVALVAHLAEHLVDRIQRLQDHVHQLRTDLAFTLAQDVEDVFRDVAAVHQRIQLEETRAALDGMETAENGVEQIHVVRPAFQLDQLFGQLL